MGRAKGFIEFLSEESKGKGPCLDPIIKRKVNEYLSKMSREYYPQVPLSEMINNSNVQFNVVVLQEDGTPSQESYLFLRVRPL